MAKSNNKKWIFTGIGVLLLFVILVAVFGKGDNTSLVTTENVEVRTITETVIADGYVQPEVEVKISSLVTGEITNIYAKEGDSVKKGDLLITINPELLESGLERAKAGLDNARANKAQAEARLAQSKARLIQSKANYDRNKRLFEDRVIAESEFEMIRSEYETAKAEVTAAEKTVEAAVFTIQSVNAGLKEAQQSLDQTRIFSPMSGIVSMLNVEKGERVVGTAQMAGTELMRVADMSSIELRVNVSENDIIRVAEGDTAIIEVGAYGQKQFAGVVREISNSSTASGMAEGMGGSTDQVTNFQVKIRILKTSYADLQKELSKGKVSPFLPGMTGMAEIKTKTVYDAVSVPLEAVTTRKAEKDSTGKEGDKPKTVVFLFKEGKAVETEVETGIQDNRYIRITKGLKEGDQIITGPATTVRFLKEGQAVEVSSKQAIFEKQKDK